MIVMCPHCAGLNRLNDAKPGAKCGKCKQELFSGNPLEMNAQQFNRALQKTDQPLVVDFWAPWCGPCQGFAPVFNQAAQQFEPAARFVKINTENEQQLAAQFGIRSIPTLAIFQSGKEITRLSGALDMQSFSQWLNQNLPK
ncbi:thioredoxin TrxC [Thiomicrorhabdus sediminis]|uniref:Thioredoxin n=1 Tax=Thiomicrorhabdus sediminis TaxID=2580412 RepID=A0A4P9K309_9GAMM|nr:thioredoxin TrxC [Thiomicrorhabdus sediminis]QCU89205.1 thioredoxin TrxC [Thiomicrorhabdus sediminis]